MHLICRAWVGVDQGGDDRVAAQLAQAAAASGPDAADRDAQPGTDLGVRHGRVLDQHEDQSPAGWRQVLERLAQCGVALGCQQLLLGRPGLLIRDGLSVSIL